MATRPDNLPEGTDSVIDTASENDVDFAPDFSADAGTGSSTGTRGGSASQSGAGQNGGGQNGAGQNEGAQAGGAAQSKFQRAFKLVDEKTQGIRQQAMDAGRGYANQGRDRAVGALDGVIKMIDDSAAQIDDKLGAQYGDYARKASEQISGLASTLRNKEVDDLLEDAQALIRKSPGIAIGAAAAMGFVLSRLIKAGAEAAQEAADSLDKGNAGGTGASPTSAGPVAGGTAGAAPTGSQAA